jgi:hypothetical protein
VVSGTHIPGNRATCRYVAAYSIVRGRTEMICKAADEITNDKVLEPQSWAMKAGSQEPGVAFLTLVIWLAHALDEQVE